MSVLMVLRVAGDPKGVEATDSQVFKEVVEKAVGMGAHKHRFFTNGSEIMVVDEWDDEESFQAFFDSTPEIPQIMANAGVTTAPTVEFWQRMEVDDALNWA
ncbi:MAG: hypothetical protein ACJ72D_22640 [Marmoricola sp.]